RAQRGHTPETAQRIRSEATGRQPQRLSSPERAGTRQQSPAKAADIARLPVSPVRSGFCNPDQWPVKYQAHSKCPRPSADLSSQRDVEPKAKPRSRLQRQIGRASCRERGEKAGVDGAIEEKG